MKKFNLKFLTIIALVLLLTVCLVACNGNDSQSRDKEPSDPKPIDPGSGGADPHTHEYTFVAAVDSTCTVEGSVEHYVCTCGKLFVEDKETGEKVEVDSEDITLQKLPHTSDGSYLANNDQHWHLCSECGQKYDVEAHTAGDWQPWDEATCYSLPTHVKKCVDCGYTMEGPEEYGEMLPHEYDDDWSIDGTYTCGDTVTRYKQCKHCPDKIEEQYTVPHIIPEEWTIDGQHECGETVTRYKKCGRCQQTIEEDDNYVIEHEWTRDGGTRTCDKCGTTENIYSFETTPSGRVVTFGSYPQTLVTEESGDGVLANLMQISGSTAPTESDHGKWSIGQGKSGAPTSILWYMDVTFNGEKYRGVYTPATQSSAEKYNWFIWEPIKWRVLDQSTDEALLLSDVILDNKYFYRNEVEVREIDGERVTQTNYYHSDIRAWLIGEFFDWAFDEVEQSVIKTTLVECHYVGEKFRTMEDKVFLLGEDEIQNPDYGFNNYGQACEALVRMETDYAAKGTKSTTAQIWWLNYGSISGGNGVMNVRKDGKRNLSEKVNSSLGVVPALKIELA